jgi:hypothetical protein
MVHIRQVMPGEPTPCREIFRSARISGRELQDLPGSQRFEPYAKLKHEFTTAHIASIPLAIRERSFGLSQGSRDEVIIRIALL